MNTRILQLAALILVSGCTTQPEVIPDKSQVELRQIQTRHYDHVARNEAMRSVVATLQDFGFVIDTADPAIGLVTGTRFDQFRLRITVTVREKEAGKISVRANARIDEFAIDEALTYQDFFATLDKAMYLTVNQVD